MSEIDIESLKLVVKGWCDSSLRSSADDNSQQIILLIYLGKG